MTALELAQRIRRREISVNEAVQSAVMREDTNNALISRNLKQSLQQAEAAQKRLDEADIPFCGVPVIVKDNICTKHWKTTCASRMLSNYLPPFDATVIKRLKQAGMVVVGKSNMDEFGMGNSTETSIFGVTTNPWDDSRVAGGSSGGSTAAVAAGLTPVALGSDTGGSIRQPCSCCGVTGLKPTYGRVSRYGLVAFASSLEQIGPIGRDARDCAALFDIISGPDARDSTTSKKQNSAIAFRAKRSFDSAFKGLKIGLIQECLKVEEPVYKTLMNTMKLLESIGAKCDIVSLPTFSYAVPAYYIISSAEASANLARFDGIRYGYRSEQPKNLEELYRRTRSEGFGSEVKRRILLGTFVLSAGYYDNYYLKAVHARRRIAADFQNTFSRFDLLLAPVFSRTAKKIGQQEPLKNYLDDFYTVAVNLAGLPAVSFPAGFDDDGLPIGLQLIGNVFEDEKLLDLVDCFQRYTDYHERSLKGTLSKMGGGENDL